MGGGGGSNTTIAHPGPDWGGMQWGGTWDNFQLDIVGFLAVLGEGSVLANAQVSALSRLFYMPRLLPAPQALLWPSRPTTLPEAHGKVTGVSSGNVKDHIHHVANVLLGGKDMPMFAVRCVRVEKSVKSNTFTRVGTFLRGEKGWPGTAPPPMGPPPVKAKTNGPLSWVSLLGSFLSVVLFIISITLGDGWSLVATLLLSFLSTLIGIGNKWNLKLPKRPKDPKGIQPPNADVVIRYPNGSYLVVRCNEDVARELYFAPEEFEYNIKSPAAYRVISLFGTLMLMLGVIALANSKLQLQFCWAAAYIISNAAHWIAAALPPRTHWDLSCYNVTEESIKGGPTNATFTDALWKAILLTKSIEWVKIGRAAPETKVWDDWLKECEEQANDVGHFYGPLITPHWPGDTPEKGTIWDVPDGWDAKQAWNDLREQADGAPGKSGARVGVV